MLDPQPVPDPAVRVVHLVAKTHLDLGFTALASEVEQQYLEDFFPRAIEVAAELRRRGGDERLTWTTGSWILHRALELARKPHLHGGVRVSDRDQDRAVAVDAAVRAGDLAWHALPLTTHTELMDAPLFRAGLAISQELDARFGRTTTAAKMTDVPGHTRAMVPLLAEAGVHFLHLSVNPAWPVPDVPRVFRWRSPDSSGRAGTEGVTAEVTVAYQAGGYGGDLVIPGCDEALAFLHSGDNLGPPSVDDVIAAHADLRSRYPGAEVRASTLDAFARALAGSGAVDELPVVTAEIGDPWLFGAGSDPQKVAAFRHLLGKVSRIEQTEYGGPVGVALLGSASAIEWSERASATVADIRRTILGVPEHTWGLDQKVVFPIEREWDQATLETIRGSADGRRFERSWDEQWDYLRAAAEVLGHFEAERPPHFEGAHRPAPAVVRERIRSRYDRPRSRRSAPSRSFEEWAEGGMRHDDPDSISLVAAGQVLRVGRWEVEVDPGSGSLRLLDTNSGRVLSDADHPLGLITHQTFDEADYERFYRGLVPTPEDEWWARRDNTKPGIDAGGAVSKRVAPDLREAWFHDAEVPYLTTYLGFPGADAALGAPPEVWTTWTFDDHEWISCSVHWVDKPATRLPEATWCSFNPIVAEPDRWELDKMGQRVSPLDVVRRGGRSLHAVGEGMHYDGPDGPLKIVTWDAPLVAPGTPNLLDADPPLPDLAGGFHVLLHDNCWGTNFPMWNEGPAQFSFALVLG